MFSTSSELKNMDTPVYKPKVRSQTEWSNHLERKMLSSEGLYTEHVVQSDDQCVVWGDAYNGDHPDQTCPLGPGVEDTEVSHLEIVPTSNYSPSPTRPTELYPESFLPQEGDEAELLGRYSYYNAKTQCAGTVKPWVRSHKCAKCGRQFGRLYNLESHMCIHKAVLGVSVEDIMSDISHSGNKCHQTEESMNRLEKMCAEAQEELHNLQELYKKEEEKPPLGVSVVESHVDGSAPDHKVLKYKRPFTCDRCGRRFRRRFNLGFHVCCSDRNTTAPQTAIVIEPDNPIEVGVHDESDYPPRKGEGLDPANKGKVFKCQFCGKVYNRRASYGTHMRWHMKERDLVSSVNRSLATGELDPLLATINMTSMGLKKKLGPTFTCQECGRVFNKQCSYSTHTLWHSKRRHFGSALALPSVNQVAEGQEVRTQEAPVPSVFAERQGNDGTKAVPDALTCQECGRVFYKRIAYSNHTRWHIKERELELRVKAASRTKDMGHQLKTSSRGGSSNDVALSSLEIDSFQGYCNQVRHLNSGEQQNLGNENGADNPEEPGRPRTPIEVPEFVFELVVGSDCFREVLISKPSEVSENVEDAEEMISRTPSPLTITTKEPIDRPVPLSRVTPYKLFGRLLKRPGPPHRCRDCGTGFSQSWKLKLHQHRSPMRRCRWKKRRCECGRSLVGLLHFLRHQLQHLSDTAFICAVCGKALRGYRQLQAHSWVHPLVSQFQCKCGARFTQLPRYLWHSLLNRTRQGRHKQERPKT